MRRFRLFAALAATASHVLAQGETHTVTLKQAIDRALAENPEVIMTRMEEISSRQAIRIAKDPFSPRVGAGSGLAYSNGFPLSIEGSAPAVFEAKANQYLFNRPQTYAIAEARENARGAGYASAVKRDDIVFRIASLYIDVDRSGRLAEGVRKQVDSLQKVLDSAEARVQLGRDLPIVKEEANVTLLRARQRLNSLEADRDYGAHNLAAALGYALGDLAVPVSEQRPVTPVPETEEAALRMAVEGSKELRRLESNYQAKALEIKGDRARRLPRVDLVAQYALLTKYSHYDQYFARFQRNNGQIGASIQIPLLAGLAVKGEVAQDEADQQHLRAEMQLARNRVYLDVHQSYQEIEKANIGGQVAKAELDLAHSQLAVLLAQMNEGRSSLKQVEEARFNEDEKWISFYDAQFTAEKARLNVLKQTGQMLTALQ